MSRLCVTSMSCSELPFNQRLKEKPALISSVCSESDPCKEGTDVKRSTEDIQSSHSWTRSFKALMSREALKFPDQMFPERSTSFNITVFVREVVNVSVAGRSPSVPPWEFAWKDVTYWAKKLFKISGLPLLHHPRVPSKSMTSHLTVCPIIHCWRIFQPQLPIFQQKTD